MDAEIASRSCKQPAGRLVRPAGFAILLATALVAAAPAEATVVNAGADELSERSTSRPQWIGFGNEQAASRLIDLLQSSDLDGLNPQGFKISALKKAVRAAESGKFSAADKANAMLDRALLSYVAALRQAPTGDWIINDRAAIPSPQSSSDLLSEAAAAPSLDAWLQAMPFMHSAYAGLRTALTQAVINGDSRSADLIRINLQRVRFLPASGRYVLVNTAAQRLFMYEGGRVVDEMRVVVGKPVNPTPMMAATIKFAALNPYWNVPPDLAAERIAPHVAKQGTGYLKKMGYVVLSDWSDQATPVDPSTIDWQAVADGRLQIRVRQNPGPHNAMGRMKFMFPNPQGVYLHDTPDRALLNEEARLFSGGCVRLEDAPRLAAWLYGKPLDPKGAATEQPVDLSTPVPVYLAYLTAVPTGGQIVFYEDIYGKDRSEIASSNNGRVAAR
jgi:murein L,D-transpeptidase YcbB/YkuD